MTVVALAERINFHHSETAPALFAWRRALEENRGARAALRRSVTPQEALTSLEFHQLRRTVLGPAGPVTDPRIDALARAAIAMANLAWAGPDDGTPSRFGAACAHRHGSTIASRFRTLIGTEDPALFLRLLNGLSAMLEGKLPLIDTAQTVFDWHWRGSRAYARRRALLSFHDAILEESEGSTALPAETATEGEQAAARQSVRKKRAAP